MESVQELTSLLRPLYSNSLDLKEKGYEAIQRIKTSAANIYNRAKNISILDMGKIQSYTVLSIGIGSLTYGIYRFVPNPSLENFAFVGAGIGLLLMGSGQLYILRSIPVEK